MKEKYKSSEFQYEAKITEKSLWDKFKEWLAYWFKKIFGLSNMNVSQKYVEYTLKTLAVLIVCYVIYMIVKLILNKEGQWIFGKNANKRNVYYSELEKNIHLLDFEKLIKESLEAGEKRTAVRYYYLWLLKTMAQHHYIEWDIEKTNSDYLYELHNPTHKEEFTYLSYLYNYIWYGEFEIDEATFQKTENRFKQSIKTFSNE